MLLLPEHNPVVVAKQAAPLEVLSTGLFVLRVGVGWSAEEYAALGVPCAARGRRPEEYLGAMRALRVEDPASFEGEFTRFNAIRVNPKPPRGDRHPVVVGGNSDAALRRAVTHGDGWYSFNVLRPRSPRARRFSPTSAPVTAEPPASSPLPSRSATESRSTCPPSPQRASTFSPRGLEPRSKPMGAAGP
ncbi:LLM class flavin-dependent oxidoreductase [Streptomyces monashensis]|uniref:LLM class flavin-dependent oxidoreductase n=1 Tax=Streptomyces monashensis TaxID=1678012 RepID=UPI000AC42147|nr:LLM class flavin-dependent oxidoreductase [Streptomyces monashensis]